MIVAIWKLQGEAINERDYLNWFFGFFPLEDVKILWIRILALGKVHEFFECFLIVLLSATVGRGPRDNANPFPMTVSVVEEMHQRRSFHKL
jgi:hypothetical protein